MGISVFEIIGPIMIGPSSSHTAGMARIGMMTHRIVGGKPVSIHLDLSPMMRNTYFGHATDAALFAGAIGLNESDPDIRRAIELAHERGVETSVDFLPEGKFPQNTALLTVTCDDGRVTTVLGTSVGGWRIIKTVGTGIMKLKPVNGVAADLASTIVIQVATHFSLPVSTTHVISSSIIGVGAAQRRKGVKWQTARNMVLAWFITIPITLGISWVLFSLIHLAV